jgi:hypothetical protein
MTILFGTFESIDCGGKRTSGVYASTLNADDPGAAPSAEIDVLGLTLLGHRAEVTGGDGEDAVTFQRENVLLRATRAGAHYAVRTRTLAALAPLATAFGAFAIAFLLLYGRTLGFATSSADRCWRQSAEDSPECPRGGARSTVRGRRSPRSRNM